MFCYLHTVGLKLDGAVVAVGKNKIGQCDVSDWYDIVAVAAGRSHTIGLKSDGTVAAVGWNKYGQMSIFRVACAYTLTKSDALYCCR